MVAERCLRYLALAKTGADGILRLRRDVLPFWEGTQGFLTARLSARSSQG
jgi:hypothetical protein